MVNIEKISIAQLYTVKSAVKDSDSCEKLNKTKWIEDSYLKKSILDHAVKLNRER